MSNMRHLLEFRHREFATFLRSRGTLPQTARPRTRTDNPVQPPLPTRTSALPLPPLPTLPTLTNTNVPSYRPTTHPQNTTPTTPLSKPPLTVMTEAIVTSARVASFNNTNSRKRPRQVADIVSHSVKRRKDCNITFSNITSPTGIATNNTTRRTTSEYHPVQEGKETLPGVATRSSSEQTEHVDESAATPGFDCDLCNTTFCRKHHLERHIQNIHEGQRPWTCDQCGFAFHQKPNLERHIMTVHQEQKPFRCGVCDMSFGRKGVLKKHVQMVHEHSRKFECDICKIPFGLKSDLKRHVQSVHQKKRPFVCDVCSASFGRRSDLKRHTLSLHPGAEVPTRKNSGPSRQVS